MTKEKMALVEEIIKKDNGELESELQKATEKEQMIEAFAKRGVELTIEDADELMQQTLESNKGELGDDDLENVVGGITFAQARAAWKTGIRIGIGCVMIYDKMKYGNAFRTYNMKNLVEGNTGFKIGGITI